MFVTARKTLLVFVTMFVLTGAAAHAQQCQGQPNGTPFHDGLFCTLTDECSRGVCVGSGDPCLGQMFRDITTRCRLRWRKDSAARTHHDIGLRLPEQQLSAKEVA